MENQVKPILKLEWDVEEGFGRAEARSGKKKVRLAVVQQVRSNPDLWAIEYKPLLGLNTEFTTRSLEAGISFAHQALVKYFNAQ